MLKLKQGRQRVERSGVEWSGVEGERRREKEREGKRRRESDEGEGRKRREKRLVQLDPLQHT
jgi:hypothetical protein